METTQHQEWRSRQHISIPAILKAGLGTGLILFIMSGGSPFSTAGTMNAIMGRDVQLPWLILVIGHFGLSLVYMAIMAAAIYRMRIPMGVVTGIGICVVLYGLSYFGFHGLGLHQQSPEFRPLMVHLVFGLFGSLIYKAASVPKPLPN